MLVNHIYRKLVNARISAKMNVCVQVFPIIKNIFCKFVLHERTLNFYCLESKESEPSKLNMLFYLFIFISLICVVHIICVYLSSQLYEQMGKFYYLKNQVILKY